MVMNCPGNQQTILDMQGFDCLGHLLSTYMSPAQIDLATLPTIEQMLMYLSYIPVLDKSNTAPWLGPNDGLVQRLNLSIPLPHATKSTLFNEAWVHLLFNMPIWLRVGVTYAVQLEVVEIVRRHVGALPKYFHALLGVQRMLDTLRTFLGFDNCPLLANSSAETPISPSSISSPTKHVPGDTSGTSLSIDVDDTVDDNDSKKKLMRVAVLRHIHALRMPLLAALKDMLLCDAATVKPSDIGCLLVCVLEWPDAGQVADILELVVEILLARPLQIFPVLWHISTELSRMEGVHVTRTVPRRVHTRDSNDGSTPTREASTSRPSRTDSQSGGERGKTTIRVDGAPSIALGGEAAGALALFLSVFSRLGHWEHVQVAAIHYLRALLKVGPLLVANQMLPDQDLSRLSQCAFLSLHQLYGVMPLFKTAYHALLELILDEPVGTRGPVHAMKMHAPPPAKPKSANIKPTAVSPRGTRQRTSSSRGSRREKGKSTRRGRPKTTIVNENDDTVTGDDGTGTPDSSPMKGEGQQPPDILPIPGIPEQHASVPSGPTLREDEPKVTIKYSEGVEMLLALCVDKCAISADDLVSAEGILTDLHFIISTSSAVPMATAQNDAKRAPGVSEHDNLSCFLSGPHWQRPLIYLLAAHASNITYQTEMDGSFTPDPAVAEHSLGSLHLFVHQNLAPPLPDKENYPDSPNHPKPPTTQPTTQPQATATGGLAALKNYFFSLQPSKASPDRDGAAFISEELFEQDRESVLFASKHALDTVVGMSKELLFSVVSQALLYARDGWIQVPKLLFFLVLAVKQWELSAAAFGSLRRELLLGILRALARHGGGGGRKERLLREGLTVSLPDAPPRLTTNFAMILDILEDVIYARPAHSLFGDGALSSVLTPDWLKSSDSSKARDREGSTDSGSTPNDLTASASSWVGVEHGADGKAHSVDFSYVFSVARMAPMWPLVLAMLRAAMSLRVPLLPMRALFEGERGSQLSDRLFDALNSSSESVPRKGGPLRVVVRLITDSVECLAGSAELPDKYPALLHKLQDALEELVRLCQQYLSVKPEQKLVGRVQTNAFVLLILQKLSAIKLSCHPQATDLIAATLLSLTQQLQPFVGVPASFFFTFVPEQVQVFVPLTIDASSQFQLSPEFRVDDPLF
jgi:hypothetical protein